jgi:hypothetical protein
MNTETISQYQARLQRLGANPAAPSVPSSGGLQKLNTESNAQFEARKLRDADGYTPPPSRANLNPQSPSNIPAPSPVPARNYFLEGAVEQNYGQDAANAQSPILQAAPRQPNYIDRTNTDPLGNSNLMEPALPRRIPVSPGVNEGLLNRLPSRSDQGRSMMTPGGMVSGEALDSMHFRDMAQKQMETAQRIEGMANQYDGTQGPQDPNVRPQDDRGFLRKVDTDPNSPTYGKASVVAATRFGPSVPEAVRAFVEDNDGDPSILYTEEGREYRDMLNNAKAPRRAARIAGEKYTDFNEDGTVKSVTDYGKWQEAREARQDRKDAARELRTRAAQLQNYGRTGGAIVDPSGGIAGPSHVGLQPTYGPNMGRTQAIGMARQQLDKEDILQQSMKMQEKEFLLKEKKQEAEIGDLTLKDQIKKGDNELVIKQQKIQKSPAMGGQLMFKGQDGVSADQRYAGLRLLLSAGLSKDDLEFYKREQFGISGQREMEEALSDAGYDTDGLGPDWLWNWFQWDTTDEERDQMMKAAGFDTPTPSVPTGKQKPSKPTTYVDPAGRE